MTLEWFNRVVGELQDHLQSICDKYDQVGHMSIDRAAKHPRVEFFVETEDDEREYFCTLFFDPYNDEFYVESFDLELGQESRTILSDIEDIVDTVHERFHEYINDDEYDAIDDDEYDAIDDDEEVYEVMEEDEDVYYDMIEDDRDLYYDAEHRNEDDIFEEIDVQWTTPEVTAYAHKDEVEIAYQFGIVEETGDGVLRRINRIVTVDEDVIEDESHFIFSKEEASTIIAMIASHMDSLSEFDFDHM